LHFKSNIFFPFFLGRPWTKPKPWSFIWFLQTNIPTHAKFIYKWSFWDGLQKPLKLCDAIPNSLIDSNESLKWKQWKGKELGHTPWLATLRGRRACWSSGMGLKGMTSIYSLTRICTNQTTHWLVHRLGTFGARMNHEQPQTHKTHHLPLYSIHYASPWGPHPNGILFWDSQVGVSKFP
jgi:hypothetical protein